MHTRNRGKTDNKYCIKSMENWYETVLLRRQTEYGMKSERQLRIDLCESVFVSSRLMRDFQKIKYLFSALCRVRPAY